MKTRTTDRPSLRFPTARLLLAAGAVVVFASNAGAADREWNGTQTDFFNPNGWTPNGEPSQGDTLTVADWGTISLNLDDSQSFLTPLADVRLVDILDLQFQLNDEILGTTVFAVAETDGAGVTEVTLRGTPGAGGEVIAETVAVSSAELKLDDDAKLSATTLNLGIEGFLTGIPGTVTLNGGSRVTVADTTKVGGDSGEQGQLTIQGQSSLETAELIVGRQPIDNPSPIPDFPGGSGTVIVKGGSLLGTELRIDGEAAINQGDLTFDGLHTKGQAGQLDLFEGSLTIKNGAGFDVLNGGTGVAAEIGAEISPGADLTVNNGRLFVQEDLTVELPAGRTRVHNDGELEVGGTLTMTAYDNDPTAHLFETGAMVTADRIDIVGMEDTEQTSVQITGSQTTVQTTNDMYVYVQGDAKARLLIDDAADVIVGGGMHMGDAPNSNSSANWTEVRVSGVNTSLQATGAPSVLGYLGDHSLIVQDQAAATFGDFWHNKGNLIVDELGQFSAGNHTVTNGSIDVSGASSFVVDNLNLGDLLLFSASDAAATMTVDESSIATVNQSLRIGGFDNPGSVYLSDGAIMNVGADAHVGHSGGSSYQDGELNLLGQYTYFSADSLDVGSPEGETATGLVTVNPQTTLDIENTLTIHHTGTVEQHGGLMTLGDIEFTGSTFDWLWGEVQFTDNVTFSPDKIAGLLESSGGELTYGQTLRLQNGAHFIAPLVINGGTMHINSAANGQLIDLQAGRLNITGPQFFWAITSNSGLGRVVDIPTGAQLVYEAGFHSWSDGLIQIRNGGELQTFFETDSTNEGQIEMFGNAALLSTGSFDNQGLISGTGLVEFLDFTNGPDGEVRVRPGDRLAFSANFADIDNDGDFYADGGTFDLLNIGRFNNGSGTGHVVLLNGAEFILQEGDLENEGQVSVEDSILRTRSFNTFEGGVATFTGTENKVFGETQLDSISSFTVSSDTSVKFFDTVTNQGEIIVGPGGRAVMLDGLTGSGDFSGGGDVEVLGLFNPGSSPGEVNFGGDLDLTGLNQLIIELSGLDEGSEYDHIDIAGLLELGGELNVQLLDDFDPGVGDSFNLIDFGSLEGEFSNLQLPGLESGQWDTSSLYSTGTISVVPEPTSFALFALGGLLLARRRRA